MTARRVVIVGGGVVGSAVAYFLAAEPAFDGIVTIVERDPTYASGATGRSVASLRQQFSTPVNIALSQASLRFLREAPERLAVDGERPDLGFVEAGYLFLADAAGEAALRRNHAVQRAAGAPVALLTAGELAARFPWLSTEGLVAGSLGERGEGWLDGHALAQAFRRKARALGARIVHDEVVGLDMADGRVTAAVLRNGGALPCDALIDAAGVGAAGIAAAAGIDLPVRPRKRCVFVFACRATLPGCPLVVDSSGVYFRPEGAGFLCGVSPPPARDPDCDDLNVDHTLFDDLIWPALARRVPAFEAIRQTAAWAGHYDYNTHDQNALLGAHPACANLFIAAGFSGHGLQHAAAVGRGLAELIVHGRYRSLDLSDLSVARLAEGRRVMELNVV